MPFYFCPLFPFFFHLLNCSLWHPRSLHYPNTDIWLHETICRPDINHCSYSHSLDRDTVIWSYLNGFNYAVADLSVSSKGPLKCCSNGPQEINQGPSKKKKSHKFQGLNGTSNRQRTLSLFRSHWSFLRSSKMQILFHWRAQP